MLTDDQRDLIKTTACLLETGGDALAIHLYALLLRTCPLAESQAPWTSKLHKALPVLPELDPMTSTCLLQAIQDVLNPSVGEDTVLGRWTSARQQLADLLIQVQLASDA